MNLDVYYCVYSGDEFAVKEGAEPNVCPFCSGEVTYSHTVDQEEVIA